MHEYFTEGTCAKKINFDITDGKVHNITFEGGCNGNLKALGILLEGMDVREMVRKLKGNKCGERPTSCADQLALAVEKTYI